MKRILLFILSFAIWCVFTWVPDGVELALGGGISFFLALFFGDIFYVDYRNFFKIKHLFYIIYYIPVFAYYCLKANIDVAYRVLHPKMPISPGIVKIKTNLKRESSITMLANSITLTPGTLTVDLTDDGYLYVHWINVRSDDVEQATKFIAQRFEWFLKKIFE